MTDYRTDADLPLILLGAGGHAKVLYALAIAAKRKVVGVCDPQMARDNQKMWQDLPVLGGDDILENVDPCQIGLINGVGKLVGNLGRERIHTRMRQAGFCFPVLIHPTAWIAPSADLADGVQVMAGAIIQPDCTIGQNTIINTCASVDHDCMIGANVHVAPGATLCGGVRVGAGAFIGAGAVVIQELEVGAEAVVGAGTTLTRSLAACQMRMGAVERAKP